MTREGDALLAPAEAAVALGVSTKTLTRWARDGKLPCTRTLGGHRRFRREDIERLVGAPISDTQARERALAMAIESLQRRGVE
jgi:excisionase family DNA binding protein